MEKIKLVNEVSGSIVSDQMVTKFDDYIDAVRRIGQLEGELEVANQLMEQNLKDTDEKLAKAEKEVIIKIVNNTEDSRIYRDSWSYIQNMLDASTGNIVSVSTRGTEDLNVLADSVVKAQATKDVKEAKEAQEKAEATAKVLEEKATRVSKDFRESETNLRKELKDKIDSALERAEKDNRHIIADQELEIKALNKENDLLLDEKSNIEKERDLAIEVMTSQLKLYKDMNTMLMMSKKTILAAINSRLHSWFFKNRIKRIK